MPHDLRSGLRAVVRRLLDGRARGVGRRPIRRGDVAAGRGRDEDGFILLESIVCIALISVLMAALTPFFVNSVTLMSRERATQGATQLATTAVETLRGLPASDLVTGRDSDSVATQVRDAPAVVKPWLVGAVMTPAVDSGAGAGAGASAVVPTTGRAQTVQSLAYTITTYLGRCWVPAGGVAADCAAPKPADSVEYLRAVVAVTWSQPRCPASTCSYVTGTLFSATGDPIFNLQQAPVAAPEVVNPGSQTSTIGTAITPLQLGVKSETGVPTMTWAVTGGSLPTGVALTPAGLISGIPTVLTAARPVTVTVTDGFLRTATATFTWTVVAAPTVVSPGPRASSLGAPNSVSLTTTCPAAPCDYVLLNGPPGLTVSSAGVITGAITGTAQVYPAVTIRVTDSNGATATSASFTWTVSSGPTVTSPGDQTTTTGAAESVALASICPNAPCTYALKNGPAGLTISGSGLISGMVTSLPQTFAAVTVTITDRSGVTATSAAFAWYVLAKPTVTSPGAQVTTIGATVSRALTTTCPNAPCGYVLNNGPAGLTISASGVITGTVTSTPTIFPAASITVTDGSGSTATTATFTWTVKARPSVTAPANQTTASGATANVALATSCSNSPCSYVLNNGPAGLSVNAAGVISGTVISAAQVFGAVSVTVTDAAGVSATSGTFTWTVVYAALAVTNPGPQKSTLQTAITPLQLSSTGGSGSVTWSLVLGTSFPAGLTLSGSGLITGTPLSIGTTTATVKATDATAGTTATATFTWTVVARPAIGGSGLVTATVGNTRSVTLPWTCPYASCTITLNNSVPGIGLSTTTPNATNNTTSMITVTGVSGTLYLTGVIQPSAVTSGTSTVYAPGVTITDGAGAAFTPVAGSWRVYLAATIASPGTLAATEGTTKSVPLAFTCPYPSCTVTLSGTMPGLGLTTNPNATGNQVLTSTVVNVTSGTLYVAGTVQSTAVTSGNSLAYTPTVRITDAGGTAVTPASGSWMAYTVPTIVTPVSQAVEPGADLALQVAATCPNGGCSYSAAVQVNGDPSWYPVPIDATGVLSYDNAPGGNYLVRVIVTDADSVSAQTTFPLTVQTFALAAPNLTSSRPSSGTRTVTFDLSNYMSPTADGYTYTLTGQPSWLTINAAGVLTATVSRSSPSDTSITVTVASTASATSEVTDTFSWTLTGP